MSDNTYNQNTGNQDNNPHGYQGQRTYNQYQNYGYGEGPAQNLSGQDYSDPYRNSYPNNPQNENNGKVLGVLSIIFGIFVSLVGLILGIIGLSKTKTNRFNKTPRILNIIGIVVSIVFIIGSLLFCGFFYGGVVPSKDKKLIETYWDGYKTYDKEKMEGCFYPGTVLTQRIDGPTDTGYFYKYDDIKVISVDNSFFSKENYSDEIINSERMFFEKEYGVSFDDYRVYKATVAYKSGNNNKVWNRGKVTFKIVVVTVNNKSYILREPDIKETW